VPRGAPAAILARMPTSPTGPRAGSPGPGTRSLARRAGWWYLAHGLPAPFAYLVLPKLLLVPGDAAASVERVRAHEDLLRAGVVGELLSATLLVFGTVAFYRLFRAVDEGIARLLAAMMLASVPISFVNSIFNLAPLVLTADPAIASALGPGETAAQVVLFLRLHGYGLFVNQVLWGLWLFPLGILVLRSGFIPRLLGYPLFVAGAGYLLHTLTMLLLPPALRWIGQRAQLLGLGELPAFLFLQIWGAREAPPRH
jgi:hypothetical protein